jgi:hypothetical protein
MSEIMYPKVELQDMDFPRSIDKKAWNQYLENTGKQLGHAELHILEQFRTELKLNKRIDKLYENAVKHKLGILGLTNLYGNCLFESLEHHNFITNSDTFREDMAYLLYSIGDIDNFFPNQPESIKTLFTSYNEVEIVQNRKDGKIYKYNYDLMCMDLASDKSWTRLNTELLFKVITHVFRINIVVVNIQDHNKVLIYYPDNDFKYVDNIPDDIYESDDVIYLGLIGEVHYIPLKYEKDKIQKEYPVYNSARVEFFEWAMKMYYFVHHDEFVEKQKNAQNLKEEKQ